MSSSSTGAELVAFLKTPGADTESISYTPNAYYIQYAPSSLYAYGSNYASAFAEFTLNGKAYYTNGYWAVRKEL